MSTVTDIGPSVDELQKLANDPELAIRSLSVIEQALNGGDEERRNWAVEALENMGAPLYESLDELIAWTRRGESLVASWGCKLVGRLGAKANSRQRELIALVVESTDLPIRQEAAAALSKLGKLDRETCAALNSVDDGGDWRLKRMLAAARGNCQAEAP